MQADQRGFKKEKGRTANLVLLDQTLWQGYSTIMSNV